MTRYATPLVAWDVASLADELEALIDTAETERGDLDAVALMDIAKRLTAIGQMVNWTAASGLERAVIASGLRGIVAELRSLATP